MTAADANKHIDKTPMTNIDVEETPTLICTALQALSQLHAEYRLIDITSASDIQTFKA